jgi:hypothetical protein
MKFTFNSIITVAVISSASIFTQLAQAETGITYRSAKTTGPKHTIKKWFFYKITISDLYI